jgi:hypothetical protein
VSGDFRKLGEDDSAKEFSSDAMRNSAHDLGSVLGGIDIDPKWSLVLAT